MFTAPSLSNSAVLALLLCAQLAVAPLQAADTIQVAANAGTQQLLARAESLLATNQSEAAFQLLDDKVLEQAGNPYFDYLLGVAALDSGRHSEAIFSLRRSLAVAPDFSGARMELARAYYEIGNVELARALFVELLDEQPPAGVRGVINDYIAAIGATRMTPSRRFTPYLELAAGHDSNANGSTADQQFLGFMLTPDNQETDSPFAAIGAGFRWYNPVSTRSAWYAGLHAGFRHNPDADFVDAGTVSGQLGMNWQRGAFFGHAGIDSYWQSRDGDENSIYGGVDVLLGRRVSSSWDLTMGVRGGALRHDASIEVLDVDRFLYSAGATYRYSPLGSFGIELIGGDDSEKEDDSPYGNSKFGGRIVLTTPVSDSGQLYASLGSLTSDYDGLFFGADREDTQTTGLVQLEFRNVWFDGLSLVPRVRYTENDSDVALYDYDRTEIGVLIRWVAQ